MRDGGRGLRRWALLGWLACLLGLGHGGALAQGSANPPGWKAPVPGTNTVWNFYPSPTLACDAYAAWHRGTFVTDIRANPDIPGQVMYYLCRYRSNIANPPAVGPQKRQPNGASTRA